MGYLKKKLLWKVILLNILIGACEVFVLLWLGTAFASSSERDAYYINVFLISMPIFCLPNFLYYKFSKSDSIDKVKKWNGITGVVATVILVAVLIGYFIYLINEPWCFVCNM